MPCNWTGGVLERQTVLSKDADTASVRRACCVHESIIPFSMHGFSRNLSAIGVARWLGTYYLENMGQDIIAWDFAVVLKEFSRLGWDLQQFSVVELLQRQVLCLCCVCRLDLIVLCRHRESWSHRWLKWTQESSGIQLFILPPTSSACPGEQSDII
jgi:hypothetical protein